MRLYQNSGFSDYIFGKLVNNDNPFKVTLKGLRNCNKDIIDNSKDIFHALYEKEPSVKPDHDIFMEKFLESIEDTSEFQELKSKTLGKRSEAYTASKTLVEKMESIFRDEFENLNELRNSNPEASTINKAMNKTKDTIRGAFREAMEEASEDADAIGILSTVGVGDELSKPQKMEDISKLISIANELKKLPNFRKIMEMIGRHQRKAISMMKSSTEGLQRIIGIETGNDFTRILPEEIALTDEPEMEMLFWANYLDEACLQHEMNAKEPLGGGNIVALIDSSGSMEGMPDMWAKSTLFGLFLIAQKQKRKLHVILFDTTSRHFEINSIDDLIVVIKTFLGGGTRFDKPLTEACDIIETTKEFQKADMFMVTDGYGVVYQGIKDRLMELKRKLQFKIITLHLGYDKSVIHDISDHTFSTLDFDKDGEVLNHLFAI